MKILVAYASKYGATKGIAEFIGEKLRRPDVQVDVLDVGEVRNPAGYDAFVLGSAVFMFHWMREGKQFLSKNKTILANHPVWLFSSGPVGGPTDAQGRNQLEVSGPKELDELKALAKPRDHHIFFGAFEGARLTGTHAFFYKMAMRSESARKSMPEGDFRDWKEIESWAGSIAAALTIPAA